MKVDLILWTLCTNGEGSSLISNELIKSLLKKYQNNKIVVSKSSILYKHLIRNDLIKKYNNNFVILPSFYRNYLIQILIKNLFPINLFCNKLITMDDFPFANHKNQILYFQQAGIVHGKEFRWLLRRNLFKLLINKDLLIYTQTIHMKSALKKRFKISNNQFISILN